VHQDDLNHILSKYHGYGGTDFASNVIEEMQCAIHVINKDNIPNNGHVVVVANHPMAGLDALALFSEVGKIKKSVKIIANDVLAHIPQFKENFIPVNKFGKKAKDSMVMVDQAYASGEMMIVFPAGLCSRKMDGVIMDLDWQKSFLAKAIQYNYTIIPVHVNGCNSNRFYRLANWRKFLGIKFNIEMLTLADELYKQKGKEITLTIGKPISSSIFNKKNVWNEAQQLKKFVYTLQGNPNATFQLD
jgi:putative hemolysin